MSGFEMKPVDEAQFDAFLQGRDDLSQLLRFVPQPKANPDLDAAIFATISAQMPAQESLVDSEQSGLDAAKISVLPTEAAANDADSRKKGLGFFQRWGMPFGLAAGAMLVTSLLLMRYDDENQSTEMLAKLEVPQADSVLVAAPSAIGKDNASSVLEEKSMLAVAPAKTVDLAKAENDNINHRGSVKQAEEKLAMRDDQQQKSLPSAAARPLVGELARAETSVASEAKPVLQRAEELAYARDLAKAAQEKLQIDDARRQAEALAQKAARVSVLAEKRAGAPQNSPQAADTELAATGLAVSEKAARATLMAKRPEVRNESAPELLAVAPPVAVAAAPVAVAAAPAPVEAPTSLTKEKSSPAQIAQAKDWLSLVEELLKAGMQEEALDEWLKFRKTYPYYPVKAALQDKMQAMQKAKGK